MRTAGRVLGVDCGGSATRTVVLVDGVVADRGLAPGANALLDADHEEGLIALVRGGDVRAAGVGLPGVRTAALAGDLSRRLTARCGLPVTVASDVEAARAGAFADGPGIVVVAGTGSAACGLDGSGRLLRTGGHGFLLGDEGSAYWIGRETVRRLLAATDAGLPGPALRDEIEAFLHGPIGRLVAAVHREPARRDLLARLAPVVDASADPLADAVLAEAGAHLGALADGLRLRLGELPVAGSGGVLTSPRVAAAFGAGRPVTAARLDPALGAALLAAPVPA